MRFNKENFKEDVGNIFYTFMVLVMVAWFVSGFGLAAACELYKNGYDIIAYSIIGIDILLFLGFCYDRYFKK